MPWHPLHLYTAAVDACEGLCTSENTGLPKVEAGSGQITTILQLVFAAIGIIALAYIIIAGIRLATSIGSDPQALSKARSGIIWAVIGLAIAVSAELIVTFVLGRL